MKRYRTFILAWYESRSMVELCQRLSIDRRGASNIAGFLRKHGIPLPKLPSGRPVPPTSGEHIDWDMLRRVAGVCAGQVEAERYRRGA